MEVLTIKEKKKERLRETAGPKPTRPRPKGYQKGSLLEPHEYTHERFMEECRGFIYLLKGCRTLESARESLRDRVIRLLVENSVEENRPWHRLHARNRDCALSLLSMLSTRSEKLSEFSLVQALWDLAREMPRPDLKPGFYAELLHLIWGIESRTVDKPFYEHRSSASDYSGREAALVRSRELDKLWTKVEHWMNRYTHGLQEDVTELRVANKERILSVLGGTERDWNDWQWQTQNVASNADALNSLISLSSEEEDNIRRACGSKLPFGVTPFYLSLMQSDLKSLDDKALRYQVFPPTKYVDLMVSNREEIRKTSDFMGEADTSPVDLVTRRYPGVVILKPFNTCPQICVYCQRNWEIDEVLAPNAMASWDKIENAVKWIGEHPAVHEVLLTGGDPLLLDDTDLERLLDMVCALPNIKRVRIGSRTPVTLPMRFTEKLVSLLGRYANQHREVVLVTHVQHAYELNPETSAAVQRLRVHGIATYNQLVYTFYSSRRFETVLLRKLLRSIGIEPYYTFLPKGKEETSDYRVPLSRLLQEENEEARLLPGLSRTDEAVYNVPRLGKNYLRARQNRDLLSIREDGSRVYEFHPWEKNIVDQKSYVGESVSILEYLSRMEEEFGDSSLDYESIWYYF